MTDEQQQPVTPFGVPSPEPGSARQLVNEMVDAGLLDELMDRVDRDGLALTGAGGFLPEMVKAVLERGMRAELTDHLGYQKHDPAGRGSPNSGNGSTPKTVACEVGEVGLDTPRDRAGSFEPRLVLKGSRRVGGLDEMIISLYAGGMTVRDIAPPGPQAGHRAVPRHHLQDHRRRAGGGEGLAVAAAAGGLPDPLPRRAGGEGPRRASGPEQGRAHRRPGSTWTGPSTCSASGCRRSRARSSGPGCAP